MRLQIMQMSDIPPEAAKVAPGAIGSVVALRWLNGTPLQKVAAVIGGSSGSYYGSEWLASVMGTPSGLTSWLIGLFAMAAAHKVFEWLSGLNVGQRIDKWLAKFGL